MRRISGKGAPSMPREFAVIDKATGETFYRSAGFREENVRERMDLKEDRELLLCGAEELEKANRELEEKLRQAEEANLAKETFLSNMSHDIRTPMNAIVGMTALAKKHIDEKARVADALNKIEAASAHLLSLINDVLDMSRINSGKMTVSRELFALGDLLHDTLAIVRPQMEQKHHTFRFEIGDILWEGLYGDPLRLRQIFVNIINNAVKYTNDGGKITVRVYEEPRAGEVCPLVFVCEDNGVGMSEAFLRRIFEPFERVSSSTVSRVEGTGLGMSIVKKLIDAMSGTIAIDSAPGRGTKVTVRLPLPCEPIQMETAALSGKRLLIIEANKAMREVYHRYLDDFDVSFRLVGSASEAIAALTEGDFRGEGFDGVILGSAMEHTGNIFDLGAYLNKAFPQLTVVLISEDDWADIEYRASRNGIRHFIPLPVFRKSLLNGLNRAFLSADEQEDPLGVPDLAGRRILLAEDNMINREIALELLLSTGASVDTAENGAEAVAAFEKGPVGYYDLILMDIQMPVMDGYAAAQNIRALDRPDAKGIKMYAMTANAFAEDIQKARDAGMDGHIAKPIDIQLLMQVLRQLR